MKLADKYRPLAMDEVVLPANHTLGPVFTFMEAPLASAWLLYGASGLGKTSVALIMANKASNPGDIEVVSGVDLDSHRVRKLEAFTAPRTQNGKIFRTVVVNDADAVPADGQVRLLHALDHSSHLVWVFTGSVGVLKLERRLLSRLQQIKFTNQRIFAPARDWLRDIASKEGLPMDEETADRIIRNSKNDLRYCLMRVEMLLKA